MTKIIKSTFVAALVLCSGFAFHAFAATPMLSVDLTGSGDQARITVSNADPYAMVTLNRRQTTQLWTVITNFGQTDSSGYFSTVASLGTDGTSAAVEQQVVVNGQYSSVVQTYPYGGCTYNCGNPYTLSLSQTGVTVNAGQSATVTAYGNYGTLYISNSPNSSVATAYVSGNSIVIYGQAGGSTSMSVCSGYGGQCATIQIAVTGGTGAVVLGQTSVTVAIGQNTSVSAYSTTGYSVYINSNSNPSVATFSMNGSNVIVNGISGGTATAQICAAGSGQCASLYVTVTGSGSYGSIYFSQQNPSLSVGQYQQVTVYSNNYGGNYYLSSNNNPSAVLANVVGSQINLTGVNSGSSTITICQSSGNQCASVYVTVGGGSSSLTLSQYSLNLSSGQSSSVTAYNTYGNIYISSNSNPGAVTASVSGNQINLYAGGYGTSTVTVCQNVSYYASSNCATLTVTVNGYSGNLSFTTTSLPQPTAGQYYSYQLQATGGASPYSYFVTSGYLPSGLTLSSSGYISGIAQSNSSGTFTVRVTDSYGRTGTSSFTLTTGGVLGASSLANGTLILTGNTVYIVYNNTRTGFASAWVFENLGYKFSQVVPWSGYIQDSGYTVSTPQAAHPWGSWIKSGRTIYFVHQSGLIPVPDWGTFLNNGGNAGVIVSANSYDFSLPILPAMSYGDYRLR